MEPGPGPLGKLVGEGERRGGTGGGIHCTAGSSLMEAGCPVFGGKEKGKGRGKGKGKGKGGGEGEGKDKSEKGKGERGGGEGRGKG